MVLASLCIVRSSVGDSKLPAKGMIQIPGERVSDEINRAVLEVFLETFHVPLLKSAVSRGRLVVPSPNINRVLCRTRRYGRNAKFPVFFPPWSVVTSVQRHPLAFVGMDIASRGQGPDFGGTRDRHAVPSNTRGHNCKSGNRTGNHHRIGMLDGTGTSTRACCASLGRLLYVQCSSSSISVGVLEQEVVQEITAGNGYNPDRFQAQNPLGFEQKRKAAKGRNHGDHPS
mmetsp:Transcript_17311/g.37942  ORF Transcript_17311/g.37942 Transcript_17311/m.37942 type:complete len:228 (+) Transcript_17311:1186-1869(+)